MYTTCLFAFFSILQDKVSGAVVVTSKGSLSHNGIKLLIEGTVTLQLSARSIGLFEAFYSSLKPIQLVQMEIEVAPGGKLPNGVTELPFEFTLKPINGEDLFDTYHGVYVNVQYIMTAHMTRGMMSKDLSKQREFVVELEVRKDITMKKCTCIRSQKAKKNKNKRK